MKARTFTAADSAQLELILQNHTAQGDTRSLAFVFAAQGQPVAEIQSAFRNRDIRVCGCSSAGEIVDGQLRDESVSGLLLDLPASAFVSWSGMAGTVLAQAEALGREAVAHFSDPQVFVLSGGLDADGDDIIRGVRLGAGRDIVLCGGLAADELSMRHTYAFTETDVHDQGLVAFIFDGAVVELRSHAVSGWEPLGAEQTVTAAEGNVLHSINGETAVAAFERFFGAVDNSGFTGTEVSAVNSQYPLQFERASGTVLRAPAFAHPNGTSVVLAGGVTTGERFRFSIAPGFDVIDETVDRFTEIFAAGPSPDAVLMVSCKARHAAFGPMLEDEVSRLADVYRVPMAGYLSYGEIGASPGQAAALHNDTCCMVALRDVRA